MIVTTNFLNKFKFTNLLKEEIHLPHGTKSAKVITHVDLDGVTSAISLVQQLQKQGIPKERIAIEFAQYGDEDKKGRKYVKMFQNKNNSQWVGVTDFAKLPKGSPWDLFNKIMAFKGNPNQLIEFMNSRDFSKIANETDFLNVFKKNFNFKETKWTSGNIESLYDCCRAYSLLKAEKNKKGNFIKDFDNDFKPITLSNYKDYKIKLVNPDFLSDHHSNDPNDKGNTSLSKGKTGEIATGSPSEAEFFANKYAPGMWQQDDLKAISTIDSAGYSEDELKNTIFLEKHFTGPNKKRNLANLISLLYDSLCKKDDKVCKWIILNSQPSLVSLYNTVKRAVKLNGDRLRMLEAVKNGDITTGKEIAETLPKILNKNWAIPSSETYKDRQGKEIKQGISLDRYRQKNIEDLEDAKSGYISPKEREELSNLKNKLLAAKEDAKKRKVVQKKDPAVIEADKSYTDLKTALDTKKGKLAQFQNFTIFDGTNTKKQYGRYMPSLFSIKGKRTPFTMRYWGGDSFFQIAVNTLYKQAAKKLGKDEVVDFSNVNRHVISDVCNFLKKKGISDFNIKRIEDEMYEKNGGHKGGIWTFNGFDLIKPPSKEQGTYWNDKEMIDRANNVLQNRTGAKIINKDKRLEAASKIVPNAVARFKNVENVVMSKYNNIRHETYRYAMMRAIYWTNNLYPIISGTEKYLENNDPRFEQS